MNRWMGGARRRNQAEQNDGTTRLRQFFASARDQGRRVSRPHPTLSLSTPSAKPLHLPTLRAGVEVLGDDDEVHLEELPPVPSPLEQTHVRGVEKEKVNANKRRKSHYKTLKPFNPDLTPMCIAGANRDSGQGQRQRQRQAKRRGERKETDIEIPSGKRTAAAMAGCKMDRRSEMARSVALGKRKRQEEREEEEEEGTEHRREESDEERYGKDMDIQEEEEEEEDVAIQRQSNVHGQMVSTNAASKIPPTSQPRSSPSVSASFSPSPSQRQYPPAQHRSESGEDDVNHSTAYGGKEERREKVGLDIGVGLGVGLEIGLRTTGKVKKSKNWRENKSHLSPLKTPIERQFEFDGVRYNCAPGRGRGGEGEDGRRQWPLQVAAEEVGDCDDEGRNDCDVDGDGVGHEREHDGPRAIGLTMDVAKPAVESESLLFSKGISLISTRQLTPFDKHVNRNRSNTADNSHRGHYLLGRGGEDHENQGRDGRDTDYTARKLYRRRKIDEGDACGQSGLDAAEGIDENKPNADDDDDGEYIDRNARITSGASHGKTEKRYNKSGPFEMCADDRALARDDSRLRSALEDMDVIKEKATAEGDGDEGVGLGEGDSELALWILPWDDSRMGETVREYERDALLRPDPDGGLFALRRGSARRWIRQEGGEETGKGSGGVESEEGRATVATEAEADMGLEVEVEVEVRNSEKVEGAQKKAFDVDDSLVD